MAAGGAMAAWVSVLQDICSIRSCSNGCTSKPQMHVYHLHRQQHPCAQNGDTDWRPKCTALRIGHAARHAASQRSRRCHAEATTGFHHSRLAATPKPQCLRRLEVTIREAHTDDELWACARLRAQCFYAYPPEREFAGKLHQNTMAKEEFEALREVREARATSGAPAHAVCLMAVTSSRDVPDASPLLRLDSSSSSSSGSSSNGSSNNGSSASSGGGNAASSSGCDTVVGSLDLCNVRAVAGEVLIGDSSNIAYLANVCVAEAARRCRVGEALIQHARCLAQSWGVDDLMVHIMAANQAGMRFYESNGFAVMKEETPDQAHHRGHCLDGVSGGGRTVLLGDQCLHSR